MNIDICKKCKRKPDFYEIYYHSISKEEIYLAGIKITNNNSFVGVSCCVYVKDKKLIDEISSKSNIRFKPEEIYNEKNEIDEYCPYCFEHKFSELSKNE